MSIFSEFPDHSRVWTFQSDRFLTADEQLWLNQQLNEYCAQWKAHGMPVKATGKILFNSILVMVADESNTSVGGCSMDDQTRKISEWGTKTGADFMNRWLVLTQTNGEFRIEDFRKANREQIVLGHPTSLSELRLSAAKHEFADI
jgi:hypothetical protein